MKNLFIAIGFVGCLAVFSVHAADAPVLPATSVVTPTEYAAGSVAPQAHILMKNAQYIYVAKQLGLLDPTKGWWRWSCDILKKYQIQISAIEAMASAAAVFVLCAPGRRNMSEEEEGSSSYSRGYGRGFGMDDTMTRHFYTVSAGVVAFTLFYTINKIITSWCANDTDWLKDNLIKFIQQWQVHRPYTPTELYPLFDNLGLISINGSFKFTDQFVQELYQQIAELSIKGIAAQPA